MWQWHGNAQTGHMWDESIDFVCRIDHFVALLVMIIEILNNMELNWIKQATN